MDEKNKLYFGDNLKILRDHVADASVDLIYLDPPFNSNATYNVLFKEKSGEESAAQIMAFEDTWQWSVETEAVYKEIVTSGPRKLADLMQALLAFLGRNDMMAYLVMMAIRLVELHRVLKPTGSIYLHCDPTASHYLKLLMDSAFGPEHFRNEVAWKRHNARSTDRRWPRVHDIMLLYSRGPRFLFRPTLVPGTWRRSRTPSSPAPTGRNTKPTNSLVQAGLGMARAASRGGDLTPQRWAATGRMRTQ